MKHSFIDKFSDLDSPIHKLDPRTKILVSIAFIVTLVNMPVGFWLGVALALALVTLTTLASRVPPLYVLGRSLVVIPFSLMATLFLALAPPDGNVAAGVAKGAFITAKAWISTTALVLLTATTPYHHLLKGLEKLGMPRALVLILSFMYRYLFVLIDEAMRMEQAWRCRAFGLRGRRAIASLAGLVGVLLIRSYERAERVYSAMLARGFDGQVRTLNPLQFSRRDLTFGCIATLALMVLWIAQVGAGGML